MTIHINQKMNYSTNYEDLNLIFFLKDGVRNLSHNNDKHDHFLVVGHDMVNFINTFSL